MSQSGILHNSPQSQYCPFTAGKVLLTHFFSHFIPLFYSSQNQRLESQRTQTQAFVLLFPRLVLIFSLGIKLINYKRPFRSQNKWNTTTQSLFNIHYFFKILKTTTAQQLLNKCRSLINHHVTYIQVSAVQKD